MRFVVVVVVVVVVAVVVCLFVCCSLFLFFACVQDIQFESMCLIRSCK